MGEPGPSNVPGGPPDWFLQYLREQQNQLAAARETEQLRVADQEKAAREARLQLVRNDSKPGKALPPLLEYYGDADKLEAWLQQARAKMEVDYYGCTEFVKFWALNGALRGKALRRMEAWVREQGTPELADSYTFLNRVDFVFKDPQAKERAQRKLESLRQGSKPFLEAFTEWQSLLMESGGGSWPDDAKKISLDRILSDELVRAMITVPSQPDFESYCSILKETDDRLRAYKARTTKPKSTPTPQPFWKQSTDTKRPFMDGKNLNGPKITRKASVESMDWEPTPVRVTTTSTKRAKWVSYEERVQRQQTGRCIRCGASGHMIRECPYGPAKRPVIMDSVRKEKDKPKEVEPELEEEESASDSEN
jgi:hypothetical protein